MTTIQKRRLLKLIAFLKALPPDKFYFGSEVSECKSNGHICPAVACAIGWTPIIWPKIVQYRWWWRREGEPVFAGFSMKGESAHIDDVSAKLFGKETCEMFWPVELGGSTDLHRDATPQEVAVMLEKFLAKNS